MSFYLNMEKIIADRAFELADKFTNVDEDKVKVILKRMVAEGHDLDDLEAFENELKMIGTN